MAAPIPPFAASDAELSEVEGFCERNGLDQIGRICAELRALRQEYLQLAKRVGQQANGQPDPVLANRRFGRDIQKITKVEDPFDLTEL